MQTGRYLLPIVGVFLALGVGLYFVNPYAPLLLLASLILQAPVVYIIAKLSYGSGYSQRVQARREAFAKDNDVQGWLAKEQQEADGFGYKLLSAKTRAQNTLLRGELCVKMENFDKALELLREVEITRWGEDEKERYNKIKDICTTKSDAKQPISTKKCPCVGSGVNTA